VNQVFQNYALFPHLTIYENIAFGLRMKRVPAPEIKKRVERVIQMTSLEAFVDRKPAQMSGGQRQRVALARAIICEPKVLLLDEPLSALDAKLRTQMRGELKQLQKKLGITFIFVTHDQEEALAMSDRVAVINEGHVEQIGTVHEIYYQPATRFVASFIGETNIIEAEVAGADATHTLCRVEGGLILHILSSPTPVGSKILLSLRPEKVRLHRADPGDRNSFPARISREVFKGAVDDITLVTEAGLELGALLPNDGQTERDFHEGEPIFASIRPEDINIIKA
jgi:spermidine/putrescine transport system ATP-binding protein